MAEKEKLDYKKLGMICGLEIHQQLNTHKLFCSCPSVIRDDKTDISIERKLKAVVGETGEIDAAAAQESLKNKTIVYQGYSDTTCPIEFDEEPPRLMNQEALNVVLQVSKLLDAKIVDEVQVMRKTVVDGSNTSGFQRTALVSSFGVLKTKQGNIEIPTIVVEEDAAKIVERSASRDIYNLSRLGIPLIELATEPTIYSPQQAMEVAEQIGLILRSTGKVKRGLGTIRQDVNVSIKGGNRVEIKGAQDLKTIPLWIENEVIRQKNLLEIKDELFKRDASIESNYVDVTNIFEKTNCVIISKSLKKNGVIYAIKLNKFSGIIGKEVQPNRRFGTELSDYAKTRSSVKGLFHSDEILSKYKISDEEIKAVRTKLKCSKDDAFILVGEAKDVVIAALDAVIDRVNVALKKVPKEVRKANIDGTSSYMRPMPGASRMYPETDCLPINTKKLLDNIKLPELIVDKEIRYTKEYDLSLDLAKQVARFDYSKIGNIDSFDDLVKSYKNLKPVFISEGILGSIKEIKRKYNLEIDDSIYNYVIILFEKINASDIPKESFSDILVELIKGNDVDYSKYKGMSDDELEVEIKKIVSANKNAPFGALMGKVMAQFRGKADGKKISDLLRKLTQ